MPARLLWILLVLLASSFLPALRLAACDAAYDQEPVSYSGPEVDDPVARLQKRLDAGEIRLDHDARTGYLRSLLEMLDIPISSQTLVFSKTSFQRDRIGPETPRALYFSDDVYVGWVKSGEVMEISAVDPAKGAIFYTLSQRPDEAVQFRRQTHECLQCHDSSLTQGIPGHIVRSVFPDARGQPLLSAGTFLTDHRSPLSERWGGWYVTGTHGDQLHMGNLVVRDRELAARPEKIDRRPGANLCDLSPLCDTSGYLSNHSDIAALMVLEHQTYVHNLIARANYQTRFALRDRAVFNRALGRPEDHLLESTVSRIRSACEPLVRGLLLADEAPLTARVAGTSRFVAEFAARGPADAQGRSLRQFDLERRMFRYPCSYLIYSAAFDALPVEARNYTYGRMWEILRGQDASGKFAHLDSADREAIVAILRATKPDLPAEWRAGQ